MVGAADGGGGGVLGGIGAERGGFACSVTAIIEDPQPGMMKGTMSKCAGFLSRVHLVKIPQNGRAVA